MNPFTTGPIASAFEWLIFNALYIPGKPLFFTNGFFVVFLLMFLVTFRLASAGKGAGMWVILFFSLWFYYKSAGIYLWVIIATGFWTYITARQIPACKTRPGQLAWFYTALLLNVSMLAFFKYTPFFDQNSFFNALLTFQAGGILFPVGLSFYTFVNIAYLIDVKKGALLPENHFPRYLAFVSFFPAVQMGPIERGKNLLSWLKNPVHPDATATREGTLLIINGLIKKMVIGDYLNHYLVMTIFSAPERYSGLENLAAVLAYSMVIYCDFSGYTDIGRGVGKWMGFSPSLNFNLPYKSVNIGEFWRRWHISLSTWLRDYLFLPVALKISSRLKKEHLFGHSWLRSDMVIFWTASLITFAICGIWHGSGLNFLIWGLMHGVALSVQRSWSAAFKPRRMKRNPSMKRLNRATGIILTFAFVAAGWIVFRSRTPEESVNILSRIIFHFGADALPGFLSAYRWPLLMLLFAYSWHFLPEKWISSAFARLMKFQWAGIGLMMIMLMLIILWFRHLGSPPPIYIQF